MTQVVNDNEGLHPGFLPPGRTSPATEITSPTHGHTCMHTHDRGYYYRMKKESGGTHRVEDQVTW